MTKKCALCSPKTTARWADWTWQPFGPGEVKTFTAPGSHYRGFPVVSICMWCKQDVENGIRRGFDYRGHHFVIDTLGPGVSTVERMYAAGLVGQG